MFQQSNRLSWLINWPPPSPREGADHVSGQNNGMVAYDTPPSPLSPYMGMCPWISNADNKSLLICLLAKVWDEGPLPPLVSRSSQHSIVVHQFWLNPECTHNLLICSIYCKTLWIRFLLGGFEPLASCNNCCASYWSQPLISWFELGVVPSVCSASSVDLSRTGGGPGGLRRSASICDIRTADKC